VSLLNRKLFRDINGMRGQIITIALLVAAGVAVFTASVSTYRTLEETRGRFYRDARFADVFVTLKRAPLAIVPRLAAIPAVNSVEPRIVRDVIVDWPYSPLPVSARLVSLANGGDETLNRLYLRRGAGPARGELRTALVNEAFAQANGIAPGTDLRVILNGRVETFRIGGIALSPEYVYAVKPGLLVPDDRFYAVLWVDRAAVESAFAMEGGFNNLIISLSQGADAPQVTEELDRLLEPYGATGAITRRDQPSNRFLEDELTQQKVMSTTIPYIFFGVAAFLLNVALGRLVTAQREQIAALKALGFPTTPIVFHYLKLVTIIVTAGSALGMVGGVIFGRGMVLSYREFFRFPDLTFELAPWSAAVGFCIGLAAAGLGVVAAIRKIVMLPPAVAMRPAAPLRVHPAPVDLSAVIAFLDATANDDLSQYWGPTISRHADGYRNCFRGADGHAGPVLARRAQLHDGGAIQFDRTWQRDHHLSQPSRRQCVEEHRARTRGPGRRRPAPRASSASCRQP
jgi:putative ABC transport system permease protein